MIPNVDMHNLLINPPQRTDKHKGRKEKKIQTASSSTRSYTRHVVPESSHTKPFKPAAAIQQRSESPLTWLLEGKESFVYLLLVNIKREGLSEQESDASNTQVACVQSTNGRDDSKARSKRQESLQHSSVDWFLLWKAGEMQ